MVAAKGGTSYKVQGGDARAALLGLARKPVLLFPSLGAKVWMCLREMFGAIYLILFEKSLFQVVTGMTAQNKTNLRPALLRVSLELL